MENNYTVRTPQETDQEISQLRKDLKEASRPKANRIKSRLQLLYTLKILSETVSVQGLTNQLSKITKLLDAHKKEVESIRFKDFNNIKKTMKEIGEKFRIEDLISQKSNIEYLLKEVKKNKHY